MDGAQRANGMADMARHENRITSFQITLQSLRGGAMTRAQDATLQAAVKKIADYAHSFVLVRPQDAAELGKHERGWNNGVGCVAMQISDMEDNEEVIEALESFAAARCAQVEADIQEIAKVCNAVQSVTHGPVSDAAGIIFSIRDLQECYGDAARARNGCYTKMQARAEAAESEVTKLKERIDVAEGLLLNRNVDLASLKEQFDSIRKEMQLSPVYYDTPEKITDAVITRILHWREQAAPSREGDNEL
jgi:hypothetical protein